MLPTSASSATRTGSAPRAGGARATTTGGRLLQPADAEPTVYSKTSRGPTPRIVAEWIDGRAVGCHQRGGTSYVVVRAGQLRLNACTVEFCARRP